MLNDTPFVAPGSISISCRQTLSPARNASSGNSTGATTLLASLKQKAATHEAATRRSPPRSVGARARDTPTSTTAKVGAAAELPSVILTVVPRTGAGSQSSRGTPIVPACPAP